MRINYHRPTSKGVTQLMYVGDDGDGLGAIGGFPTGPVWYWLAGAFAIGWLLGKKR